MARLAVVAATAAATAAGCLGPPPPVPTGVPNNTPAPSLSGATDLARVQLEGALRAAGFGLIEVRTPYRPAEAPAVAAAPRLVLQVVLPADPESGLVIIYELPDAASANSAGRAFAAYLGTGPGKVQFPPDSQFLLRQIGSTLVFYSWSPANMADPRAPDVPVAIQSLGEGIPVPR